MLDPKVIVADEAVSALDVSIKARFAICCSTCSKAETRLSLHQP